MTWEAETVDGVTFWRAETEHNGKPIALVVAPHGDRWIATAGRGPTRGLADRGSLLTIEATAERAKACAAGWAEGV